MINRTTPSLSNGLHVPVKPSSKAELWSESAIWKTCKSFMGTICLPLSLHASEEKKLPPATPIPTASLSERIYKTIANHPKEVSALAVTMLTATIGYYALYQNSPSVEPPPLKSFSPLWILSPFALIATVGCAIETCSYLALTRAQPKGELVLTVADEQQIAKFIEQFIQECWNKTFNKQCTKIAKNIEHTYKNDPEKRSACITLFNAIITNWQATFLATIRSPKFCLEDKRRIVAHLMTSWGTWKDDHKIVFYIEIKKAAKDAFYKAFTEETTKNPEVFTEEQKKLAFAGVEHLFADLRESFNTLHENVVPALM